MAKKIEDFGQKIGGARKDAWIKTGLTLADLEQMTPEERAKYVEKKYIWIKPDYESLKKSGKSPEQCMFAKTYYDSLPKAAAGVQQEDYIAFIQTVKKFVDLKLELSAEEFEYDIKHSEFGYQTECLIQLGMLEINNMYHKRERNYDNSGWKIYDRKMAKDTNVYFSKLKEKVDKSRFLLNDAEYFERKTHIFQVNGKEVAVEDNGHSTRYGSKALEIRDSGNIAYLYGKDIDQIKLGDYVLVCEILNLEKFFPTKSREEIEERKENLKQLYVQAMQKIKDEEKVKEAQERANKPKKEKYIPSILDKVERTGPSILRDIDVDGEDYLETFNFHGGEFGNWLSDKERQQVLNHGYEAFIDLANALEIDTRSISLGGKLSIAFGARGKGSALAHYEPERNVINLTKMKGAGALAHEFGHAIDKYLSDSGLKKDVISVVAAARFIPGTQTETQFFKDAKELDRKYRKSKAYWSTPEEMFARAFACYVQDKLPYKSDYLDGLAFEGGIKSQEDKDIIYKEFDKLFDMMKEKNLLECGKADFNKKLREIIEAETELDPVEIEKRIEYADLHGICEGYEEYIKFVNNEMMELDFER